MPRHILRLLLRALATALPAVSAWAAAPAVTPPAFDARALGQATLPLSGGWRFHTGDDKEWARPDLDDTDWEQIEAGKDWEQQGHPGYFGTAWYRRAIAVPADAHFDLALYLPSVQNAAEVYWNGSLVGSIGKLPPHAVWYEPANPDTGVIALGPARSGVLAIRVWKAPYAYQSYAGEGGLAGMPQLGSLEAANALRAAAQASYLRNALVVLFVALAAALVSIGAWVVWLRDRSNWMLFWLALLMLRPIVLLLSESPYFSWRFDYGVDGALYSVFDVSLWFLLLYLLGLRDHPRLLQWTRIFAYISIGTQIVEGSLQLFDWERAPRAFLLADVAWTLPGLLTQAWCLVLLLFAVRQRLDWPRWLLVASALAMDGLNDFGAWTDLGERWTHWTVAQAVSRPLFMLYGSPVNLTTLSTALLLVAVPVAAWHSTQQQRRRNAAYEQEMHSARELQQFLIPLAAPVVPGFAIASAYRPAREVGGDFFQILPLERGDTMVVIGDVSGKGLGAAMAVALIVGALRATVEAMDDPADVLSALNRRLHGRLQSGFATCLAMRVNAEGTCRIANAGHLSPYLNGREVETAPALPLGLVAEAQYEVTTLTLAAGDQLTCMTDGVPEASNASGELFGFGRTAEIARRSAAEIADAAHHFGQEDDITVLTLAAQS